MKKAGLKEAFRENPRYLNMPKGYAMQNPQSGPKKGESDVRPSSALQAQEVYIGKPNMSRVLYSVQSSNKRG